MEVVTSEYANPSKWHPAAKVFPLLPQVERTLMAADILEHGLKSPIVLHDGMVLDGRNRLLACVEVGVAPRFVEWESDGRDPMEWVLSLNLRRRHLDPSQRAALAYEVKKYYIHRQGARTDLTSVKNDKSSGPRAQAAERFGVSEGYVFEAGRIFRASPKAFEQVKTGEMSLQEAKRYVEATKKSDTPDNPTPFPDLTPMELRVVTKFLDAMREVHELVRSGQNLRLEESAIESVLRQVDRFRDDLAKHRHYGAVSMN